MTLVIRSIERTFPIFFFVLLGCDALIVVRETMKTSQLSDADVIQRPAGVVYGSGNVLKTLALTPTRTWPSHKLEKVFLYSAWRGA